MKLVVKTFLSTNSDGESIDDTIRNRTILCKNISLPWTDAEMRRYTEGIYSIQQNLPAPNILTTKNGSAFVLP